MKRLLNSQWQHRYHTNLIPNSWRFPHRNMADTPHQHSPFFPRNIRYSEDRGWNHIQRFPWFYHYTSPYFTALLPNLWVSCPVHQYGDSWSEWSLQVIHPPCCDIYHHHKWHRSKIIMEVDRKFVVSRLHCLLPARTFLPTIYVKYVLKLD